MERVLTLAERGRGATSPNPMVGAVMVKNNRVVAEGYHQKCGGAHAEIIALNKAGKKATGSTLYVNLEPCSHYGRTPPCVDRILKSGLRRVVIAMRDPNPLTNGKSISRLRRAGVKTEVGLLGKEAKKLNEAFIVYITKKRPFIVAKTAQTLDGKIATFTGDSKWITDEKTRLAARQLRKNFDAILVGIQTVLKDDPKLTTEKGDRQPIKIILDSRLRIPLGARLFRGILPGRCIIATTKKASQQKIDLLKQKGIEVLDCSGQNKNVDWKILLRALTKREIASVLIEGGGKVVGSALKEGIVDKMHIYVAPKIIGDKKAVSAIEGMATKRIAQAISLSSVAVQKSGPDIFIEAYVHRNR